MTACNFNAQCGGKESPDKALKLFDAQLAVQHLQANQNKAFRQTM